MSNYKQDEALIKKNLSELTTRIGRLEQNISLGDDISRDWLNLQFSKLIRRIGILEKAQDISTPDRFTDVYNRMEKMRLWILDLESQVGKRNVGEEVIKNDERITAIEKQSIENMRSNFRNDINQGVLKDHVRFHGTRLDSQHDHIEDIKKQVKHLEKWRAGTQGDPTEDVREAPSEDIDMYRCPLCGATGYLSSDITNCECGAKLKLSHHGKIVCLYSKSYEAKVYKI